jgi:hypothetical protein
VSGAVAMSPYGTVHGTEEPSAVASLKTLFKNRSTKDGWFIYSRHTGLAKREKTGIFFGVIFFLVSTAVCVAYTSATFGYVTDHQAVILDTVLYGLPIALIWAMWLTTPKFTDLIFVRDEMKVVCILFTCDCLLSYLVTFTVTSYYWSEFIFTVSEATIFTAVCYAMTGYVVKQIEKDEAKTGRRFTLLMRPKSIPNFHVVDGVEGAVCCRFGGRCPLWCAPPIQTLAYKSSVCCFTLTESRAETRVKYTQSIQQGLQKQISKLKQVALKSVSDYDLDPDVDPGALPKKIVAKYSCETASNDGRRGWLRAGHATFVGGIQS